MSYFVKKVAEMDSGIYSVKSPPLHTAHCPQNARGGSSTNMSCTVLYTKYDTVRVGLCVGSTTAATMLRAESAVHRCGELTPGLV